MIFLPIVVPTWILTVRAIVLICVIKFLWMGSGTLGYYYFGHTTGMVLGNVVSYDPHIVVSVLHNVPVVDISLGPPPLANNVHNLALDIHLFEHRVVGMESVAAMHTALVEVDNLVGGVVGIVDTVKAVLLCVGVVFGYMGYMGFEQDSSCSSGFVAPMFFGNSSLLKICLLRVAIDTRFYLLIV